MSYQHDWSCAILVDIALEEHVHFAGLSCWDCILCGELRQSSNGSGEHHHGARPWAACTLAHDTATLHTPGGSWTGIRMAITCTWAVSRWSVWAVQSFGGKRKVRLRCDLWALGANLLCGGLKHWWVLDHCSSRAKFHLRVVEK